MKERLEHIDRVIEEGPFKADWNSLCKWTVPAWFQEKRFGIFIHWGLYSVPENSNEWYSRNMYIKEQEAYAHHRKVYGEQKDFGYKDFIPMFTAKKFNPNEWARLFKNAGAEYVCPVAEHHDGFQMYQSDISKWNAYEMGPKRDILGELKSAIEEEGMEFCTSSHRAEHWFFMGCGKEIESDIKEPLKRGDFYWPAMPEPDFMDLFSTPYPNEEFLQDWLIRCVEILDKYQPSFLYFDWWIQHEAFKPYLLKLAAYYYNQAKKWGKEVAICYKYDAMMFGTGIVEIERGGFAEAKSYPWQTDTAVAKNSWCYTSSLEYKTSREIIEVLIDAVSKNGNLLLNVGPKADGSIPDGDRKILEEVGAWMSVNREAIHSSYPWKYCQEGPTKTIEGLFQEEKGLEYTKEDFRFTISNGALYVFSMNFPKDGLICIRSLALNNKLGALQYHGIIKDVKALGFEEKPYFEITQEGLMIKAKTIQSDYPVVFKIEMK